MRRKRYRSRWKALQAHAVRRGCRGCGGRWGVGERLREKAKIEGQKGVEVPIELLGKGIWTRSKE